MFMIYLMHISKSTANKNKVPPRSFHLVLIVAAGKDKSGTAYSLKDLVWHKHLLQERVKDTGHLMA